MARDMTGVQRDSGCVREMEKGEKKEGREAGGSSKMKDRKQLAQRVQTWSDAVGAESANLERR